MLAPAPRSGPPWQWTTAKCGASPRGDCAPDRVNDARFNAILWRRLNGDQPYPRLQSKTSVHLLHLAK